MHFCFRLPILPALLLSVLASGQISEGGIPPSFSPEHLEFLSKEPLPEAIKLAALDAQSLLEEDSQQPWQSRFSAPLPKVDISPDQAGQWTTLPNGDRVWRCVVLAPKALGLLLMFDQFQLPAGSRFFAYTPDQKRILGAYTEKSCLPSGKFMIGILPGERAVMEFYEPASVRGLAQIHLNRIDYVYDPAGVKQYPEDVPDDFGQSSSCHININCTQGQNWQTSKESIARVLMIFSNGAGWCSGTLVANTSNTDVPYFLTAHHCQIIGLSPNFDLWRFDFGYEAPSCPNPATEPTPKSVLGCERISYRHETDFMLLKLNQIPGSYHVFFSGWSRTTATNTNVPNSVFIHHPNGDIKKITVDNNPAIIFNQTINWGAGFGITPAGTHWSVIPEEGFFEPGSSGSPLLDPNRRVVGQLHGGNFDTTNCKVSNSWFGRFDLSWDQGGTPDSRLKEWLDPEGKGFFIQNGYWQPAPTEISIGGTIKTHWGTPMPNVLVTLSGDDNRTTRTDATGKYIFENLPAGLNYQVTPTRDTNDVNGISTFDLALINKHVLALDSLDSPWKIIAADANRSKSVTTIDIVESRKILLGLNTAFPNVSSWRFFPATTTFQNPYHPFSSFPTGFPPEFIQFTSIQNDVLDVNFTGVKMGDVNDNAKAGG